MKKQVGQREKVNLSLKEAMMLVSVFIPGASKPPTIVWEGKCEKCKFPLSIKLSEEVETGKIWIEGPDKCEKCDHQLSNESATVMLTQDQIFGYFGKY
jgi:hypothetical protein